MSLPSNYLDAFTAVARQKSFSLAAQKLHITQSALSQRVINLEQEVGSTLFLRESSGARLTDLGQKLLRYCQSKELLENEFLSGLKSKNRKSLTGLARIAGFSTVTRSVLIPLVADLIKLHPEVQIEVRTAELRDLPGLLFSGACDFTVLNRPIEKQGIENVQIGTEENVLIQSSAKNSRRDVYLDHDEEDTTTHDFLKLQGRKVPAFKRSYLDDIYSILDGVRYGLGRAVVPRHLTENIKGIEVVENLKPLKVPVYLNYYSQAFYTDLQKALISQLTKKSSIQLS